MSPTTRSDVEQAASILGSKARRGVTLAPFTTYKVGGPAALLLEVHGHDDLQLAQDAVSASGVEVLVVGRGSNLLVSDDGFDGLALVFRDSFASVDFDGCEVTAGAAVTLPVLARRTAAAALTGLEWAVGVPGSVGGAVRMNAGGHGSDVSRALRWARVVDLAAAGTPEREVEAADLDLAYRHSAVRRHEVVTSARFRLEPGDRMASEHEIGEIVRWRRAHQPGGPNAGSVFTNPPGDSAGRLIDAAGLKGLRVGSATVSTRHANFIQVDDGGSAADVVTLMETVQWRVLEATGTRLQPEVHLIGFQKPLAEVET